jgi:hypothetical protein
VNPIFLSAFVQIDNIFSLSLTATIPPPRPCPDSASSFSTEVRSLSYISGGNVLSSIVVKGGPRRLVIIEDDESDEEGEGCLFFYPI